ncbi:hypothetical protein JCM6882_002167 [Rhodosporidiobolus microsporus]
MNTLRTLQQPLCALAHRAPPAAARAAFSWSFSSSFSSSAASSSSASAPAASTSAASPPSPAADAAATPTGAAASHYLVTLLRSPLHLPKRTLQSVRSLGLGKRLSSSIVPITPSNAGYILALKELVGVRTVTQEQVKHWASREWRERKGEGNQGAGMRVRADGSDRSVIRVGSERARGDERGFKVVQ